MSGAETVKGHEEPLDIWPSTSPWQRIVLYLMGPDTRDPGPPSGIRNQEKHSKYSKVGSENNKLGVLLLLSETVG